ncbi:MAG: cupin domain-containing protein [candidate division Zixibacteria bacterium]|nr:cupin domain-containing protein [candidate division Zixibacteria bacterium]
MIRVIRANQRHFSDFNWLKTYWLFSFADYFNPDNIQFGALRVFNDDVVEPGTGFPTHPHREMEIITIVLDGKITHEDSMGNKAVIKPGEVQRMSAGTGLTHSEFNLDDKPVHFYQIWIYPDEPRLKPGYDQKKYSPESWKNTLFPVASGQGIKNTVSFHADATIYRSSLEAGKSIEFDQGDGRRAFVYLTSGKLDINSTLLNQNDQARIDEEKVLKLTAMEDTGLIFIDVPSCKGWGYDKETLKGSRA